MDFITVTNSVFDKEVPTTKGEEIDEKLQRFASGGAAVPRDVVSGSAANHYHGEVAKEKLAFILSYCASKGYPQALSNAADDEAKTSNDHHEATSTTTTTTTITMHQHQTQTIIELLKMECLKLTPRQIVYDAIRAAEQEDGLLPFSEDEKDVISNKPQALEDETREEETTTLLPALLNENESEEEEDEEDGVESIQYQHETISSECQELSSPISDRINCLFPQSGSQSGSSSSAPFSISTSHHNPVPIVMISDPGQDLDDEMMFIMSSHLHALGLISVRGVIANLHPSLARARLTRGTFDLLGLHNVPVGIGTDGGDNSGMHSSEQFESTSSSYIIKEDEEEAMKTLEPGHELLRRLYQAAPDIEYVDTVDELRPNGESVKGDIKGGLTIVVTSSFKDISIFVRDNPKVFASKTREVVVMGGCEPVLADAEGDDDECKPDSANNNTFDPEASAHFYSACQRMNVTLTVVSRHSAYAAKMPRSVYDDLAITGSAIGLRLRNSQRAGIDQLWTRAVSSDPSVRKGLPPRCNREWFVNTFCGGNDDANRSEEDSVWDLVTGFMQYDTLALLASIPGVREALFGPTVLPPLLRSQGSMQGEKNGGMAVAFDTGTRNLIGTSAAEHGLKEPSLLVQLLKTGYRQGLLCNHTIVDDIVPPNDCDVDPIGKRHQNA